MAYNYFINFDDMVRTPLLTYHLDLLHDHADKIIKMAGQERLWPHVKTHKSADLVRLLQAKGIRRFKCATLAEAEMLAQCRAEVILIAYPLVGDRITRFADLRNLYPQSCFWAIGDDFESVKQLSDLLEDDGQPLDFLLDCDVGMHRTGVALADVLTMVDKIRTLPGIQMRGLHVYDGHHHAADFSERMRQVEQTDTEIIRIFEQLKKNGPDCDTLVLGGTPSFPCHLKFVDRHLPDTRDQICFSPGTLFVNDWSYYSQYAELPFVPAVSIATRVVSTPGTDRFTVDLGYKHIAADPVGVRGILATRKDLTLSAEADESDPLLDPAETLQDACEPMFQSEEHWAFRMKPGCEQLRPAVGTILQIVPTHVCPTTALYRRILVVQQGKPVATWAVSAREDILSFEKSI